MAQKKVKVEALGEDDAFAEGPAKYVPKDTAHRVDIAVRLGDKIALKGKLEAVAVRNGLPMNTLMIQVIQWWLKARSEGGEFSMPVK